MLYYATSRPLVGNKTFTSELLFYIQKRKEKRNRVVHHPVATLKYCRTNKACVSIPANEKNFIISTFPITTIYHSTESNHLLMMLKNAFKGQFLKRYNRKQTQVSNRNTFRSETKG